MVPFHAEPSASLISPLNETDRNERGWNPDRSFPPSLSVLYIPAAFPSYTPLPSLTPTHHTQPSPPHASPPFSLPMCDLSNLADCTPWAYSAESNASLFLFGSHSSAPVRSHSHLACVLEMGLSGIPSLPFPNRVIENGTARANTKKKKKKEEKCHAATSSFSHLPFWYMNETQQVVFQRVWIVYLEISVSTTKQSVFSYIIWISKTHFYLKYK